MGVFERDEVAALTSNTSPVEHAIETALPCYYLRGKEAAVKIGRNQLCPCNSGRKYKHCHGPLASAIVSEPAPPHALSKDQLRAMMQASEASERIRQKQQGHGRGIVSAQLQNHRVVAVGNTVHWSDKWKTFPDFLGDYLKKKLTAEWGNAEIAKPLTERHPLMQWYDALCHYQAKVIKTPGKVVASDVNGVVAAYYSVAYGLYLLDHNVELQDRLLKRLRDPGNFQGAYYELLVASALLRGGFELTLEDETDPSSKHCEFAAVSKESGKKYWVEAKMRAVAGQLGRTAADGTSSPNPISQMVRHLNKALAKPAADERMIFIDLNAPMAADVSDDNRPPFVDRATSRLERYEQESLPAGVTGYVFITNTNFHHDLNAPAQLVAFPFGLGMPDFNRPGFFRLSERYLQEKKHADALRVADSLSRLLALPSTFDGSLPNVALNGEKPPIVIGQRYKFEGAGAGGEDLIGTVADATVLEAEKAVYVVVNSDDGQSCILKEPMSDGQLADYKAHPDAYFGKIVRPPKDAKTKNDLFEFFMDAYGSLSREELLVRLAGRVESAEEKETDELLAIYCEGWVAVTPGWGDK
jgi:hypothetical protein